MSAGVVRILILVFSFLAHLIDQPIHVLAILP